MSEEIQHTPGPWHVHGREHFAGAHIRAGDINIAYCIMNGHNMVHGLANLTLMAEAPSLLESVETLIERADDLISAIDGTTGQFEAEVAALSEAVSAAEKVALRARGLA